VNFLQTLITQHANGVALSFSKFGIDAPVNEETLAAAIMYYGDPFIQILKNIVGRQNFANYAADDASTTVAPMVADDPRYIKDPVANLDPGPIKAVFPDDNGGGVMNPPVLGDMSMMPPVHIDIAPMLTGNGGMLPAGNTLPADSGVTGGNGSGKYTNDPYQWDAGESQSQAEPTEKTFWEKYKTLIIILIILLLIGLFMRRSAPVIIK
jgi:hypothetical protein